MAAIKQASSLSLLWMSLSLLLLKIDKMCLGSDTIDSVPKFSIPTMYKITNC